MAPRIPEHVVEDVVSRVSILDVVGEYVRLKRRGSRYIGLCPFHNEKTPSFTVNAERGLYHCFGCGASGNTVSFLMNHDGLTFPETLRKLADRVGITVPEPTSDGHQGPSRSERDTYYSAMSFANDLYQRVLWSGRYPKATAYLEERGIDRETAETFMLGYAPGEWSTLVDAAQRKGIKARDLETAGMIAKRRSGDGYYDRFRDRIMFPIINLSGRVLAFSGRTLDPEERAKYINSPETPFYTKGKELYGLQAAQRSIRDEGAAILVEGNFDVVSMHAHGFTNTCAALGTALTHQQGRLLRRFADRTVLAFDGDSAGRKAAVKAMEILLQQGAPEVVSLQLADGDDPDTFLRREGAESLKTLIDAARPLLDLQLEEILAPAVGKSDPRAKRKAMDEVGALLSSVRDPFLWGSYVRQVATRIDVDEQRLVRYLKEPRSGVQGSSEADARPVRAEKITLPEHERLLIEVLAMDDELLGSVHRKQLFRVVQVPDLGGFLEQTAATWEMNGSPGFREAVSRLDDGPLKSALIAALAEEPTLTEEQVQDAFDDVVRTMTRRWILHESQGLREEIRRAENEGRFDEELYRRQQALNHWLREIQAPPRV